MDRTVADEMRLAGALARAGAAAALPFFNAADVEQRLKGSASDPVSAADHAADEVIAQQLATERPWDGIASEEGQARPSSSGRVWHIDPLDGTLNFLAGIPLWCCQLALADEQGPLAAAIYHPHAQEMYVAGRGQGTYLNGQRLSLGAGRPLSDCAVGTYLDPNRQARPHASQRVDLLTRATATLRIPGSGGITLAWTAAGRLDATAITDMPAWDWLPGQLMVEEAGGQTGVAGNWQLAAPSSTLSELVELLA